MGAKWVHRLSNIDSIARTADCIVCGRVSVKRRMGKTEKAPYRWACKKREKDFSSYVSSGHSRKQTAVEYKGGECQICGYKKCLKALQFHHLDPSKKEHGIAVITQRAHRFENARNELDKCILLCANCHVEVHAGITPLPA